MGFRRQRSGQGNVISRFYHDQSKLVVHHIAGQTAQALPAHQQVHQVRRAHRRWRILMLDQVEENDPSFFAVVSRMNQTQPKPERT
jgi:hypothetical protein